MTEQGSSSRRPAGLARLAPGGGVIEISELARLLDAQAHLLAPELLPNGRREGHLWATSNVSDTKSGQYSLKVTLDGAKRGGWSDYGYPKGHPLGGGDMLKLVALVHFGGDVGKACQWARSWLGLDDLSPDRLARQRAEVEQRRREASEDAARQAERMERRARGLWGEAEMLALSQRGGLAGGAARTTIEATPADLYLKGRGIDLGRLPRYPRSLRFHPRVFCAELKDAGEAQPFLPALLAIVLDMAGAHRATHRIYLKPDGSGKADLLEPKKCLGSFWGRYVPLWKGAAATGGAGQQPTSGYALHRVPAGSAVDVSEGIEDGLTIAVARPERRVIAAVTLGNIGALELPEQVGTLTVIGQNDEKAPAQAALKAAVERQAEAGREVRLFLPPSEVAA